MARRKSQTLTEVELEFMQIVWAHDEVTTEDVQNALAERDRHISDGAIRRILAILMEKGFLSRRREGLAFKYRANIQEKQAHSKIFHDMLTRAFGGSGSLMLAAFLDSVDVTNDEFEEIKRLIEKRERREGK